MGAAIRGGARRGAMSQSYLSVDDWLERNCEPDENFMPALGRLREHLIGAEFGVTGWRCTWDRYGRLMETDYFRSVGALLAHIPGRVNTRQYEDSVSYVLTPDRAGARPLGIGNGRSSVVVQWAVPIFAGMIKNLKTRFDRIGAHCRSLKANLMPSPISMVLANQFWMRAQVGRRASSRANAPPANATIRFVGIPVT
jgi:hypothetical protein